MIGDKIKALRTENEMSQTALAQQLGVSTSTVGMYEQNRRKPDVNMMENIAEVFGVSVGTLYEHAEKKERTTCEMEELFAANVFSPSTMKACLPGDTFAALQRTIEDGNDLGIEDAQIIAEEMMKWALSKGATHYSHWFQPLTGLTAEKQDSFLERKDGRAIMEFSGKALIRGETDASSFPSGGLRATFEARGYTTWDCTSPVFIREEKSGQKTLVIPTAFCSYNGVALDKKTPLMRSTEAINKQAVRLLHLIGETGVTRVEPMVGGEQEYFLIREKDFQKRRDLMFTGRTLFGSNPPKGQELGDQYYATISERITKFMVELNNELWKLGIVSKTQHNEVAPAQYELAVQYDSANVAADHNQLVMEMLKRVAGRHGLVCLLNEKPFKNINGSGKHNNWSLVTDTGENLFKPGKRPYENNRFLLFFTAVIAAVDDFAGALRASCASLSNDLRIGGYEAPPAIISISTGEFMEIILDKLRKGEEIEEGKREYLETGVSTIQHFKTDNTDRNRTSPFAFTGDKFEFRMVGSSQSLSDPNITLNTVVCDKLRQMADRIEKAKDKDAEQMMIVKEWLNNHWRILFNGNNYAREWIKEAKKRGLPNITDTVEAIVQMEHPDVIVCFDKNGVLSEEEMRSRVAIQLEVYAKQVHIEAMSMIGMVNNQFIPAAVEYTTILATNINQIKNAACESPHELQKEMLLQCSNYLDGMSRHCRELSYAINHIHREMSDLDRAVYVRDELQPIMTKLRRETDKLESIMDTELWPIPTFSEMLFY